MGLTGDFGKLEALIASMRRVNSHQGRMLIARSVAEEYRSFMTECFQAGQSPYGQAWEKLKLRTSSGGRSQIPLSDTGLMRGAVTPKDVTPEGFRVVVGRAYATVHQYGATIVPKTKKALRFRGVTYKQTVSKSGRRSTRRKYGSWIFAKRVTIPARPYAPIDGMPAELDSRVRETIDEAVTALLKS